MRRIAGLLGIWTASLLLAPRTAWADALFTQAPTLGDRLAVHDGLIQNVGLAAMIAATVVAVVLALVDRPTPLSSRFRRATAVTAAVCVIASAVAWILAATNTWSLPGVQYAQAAFDLIGALGGEISISLLVVASGALLVLGGRSRIVGAVALVTVWAADLDWIWAAREWDSGKYPYPSGLAWVLSFLFFGLIPVVMIGVAVSAGWAVHREFRHDSNDGAEESRSAAQQWHQPDGQAVD